ncbi:MAG: hypothetical protein V3T86_03730 [Planctomycetota bacterium]
MRRVVAFVLLFLASGSIVLGQPLCCLLPAGDGGMDACCAPVASTARAEDEGARDLEGGTCPCCGEQNGGTRGDSRRDASSGDNIGEQDRAPAPPSPLVCDCPHSRSFRTGVIDVPADVPVPALLGEAIVRWQPMPIEVCPFANRRDETAHGLGALTLPLLL